MNSSKTLRVVFRKIEGDKLIATNSNKQTVVLHCDNKQIEELTELPIVLQTGNILNWVNVKEKTKNTFETEFIIFEPDYLIDIGSLAGCFKSYGNHYLNYTLARLQQRKMTMPMLLGNIANFFIDELINEDEDENQPIDYTSVLAKAFQAFSFEFTTCEDLRNSKMETDFFVSSRKHFEHIKKAVKDFFPKAGIDRKKIVIEPSFICKHLGLQGRLDALLQDNSKFIELKSGKAKENFRTGKFLNSAQNHYIQVLLYLAVLEFNLNLPTEKIDSYLLYSRYPILKKEGHSRQYLQSALSLRNQIVACEYNLQKNNNTNTCFKLLNEINSNNLNLQYLSDKFFIRYLAPSIDKFYFSFSQLKEYEKIYFLRLYIFVVKELWLSKVGQSEYEGVKKPSVLWDASFEDKLITGGLLHNLRIIDIQSDHKSSTISFTIPEYKDLYLPNFRQGDSIVLYQRSSETDTVGNRQVFKGIIEYLERSRLKIRLRYRQKNLNVWDIKSFYAIEHDYIDSVYVGMFRALASFVYANQDRKDLLTTSFSSTKNEKEIFLLIGPPGTGKTSIALKQMVENEVRDKKANILLLSYTNRAVDEICRALSSISFSLEFIRIGNEVTCEQTFHSHLLEKHLKNCTKRSEIIDILNRCQIYVGTVASIWNKPELFHIKQFDLAIIDEATQLLEPHLLGIFCAKNCKGENAIRRFILIGDHKQLPAVVLQTKEESRVEEAILNTIGITNLSDSLFERFYRQYKNLNLTSHFSILTKQGRMHPDIAYFPSRYFYESRLTSAGLPHQIEFKKPNQRLYFYSVFPSEKETATKANINEAIQVVNICKDIYQEYKDLFNSQTIGIITPFRNQTALIHQQLSKKNINFFSEILVDTVERFQGSQRDIIIYSFCIKTEKQLENLPNYIEENGKLIDRKLNVILTRARKQLYIVGNESLLTKNLLYKQLIEHIKGFKLYPNLTHVI